MSKDIAVPTKLIWMDLEFTHFDYPNALVLEVSVEITDFQFNTIASYEARILALEEEITGADPADVEFIKERIATFKVMIESLRADLAKLPPT